MNPPRYFVPHSTTPAEPVRAQAANLVNVVDIFCLESASLGEQEWITGLDVVNQLIAVPSSERGQFPPSVQAQLAYHEVASGRLPRRIAAKEFFLFSIELVEHPADEEGFNDPVYLYGTLSGPWPGEAVTCVPGQLTVSRGTLLAGLVHGAADDFLYARNAELKTAQRSYHALLPGDRPEFLVAGRGLILAYPAAAAAMEGSNTANARLTANILHDVLTQLREDARAHGGPEFLRQMEIPVPSRAQAVAELEARGYKVRGDVAVLRRSRGGLAGKLAGLINSKKVKVPREAGVPEFIELARQALNALPGWPNDAERKLRTLIRPGGSVPLWREPPPSPPAQPPVVERPTPPPLPSARRDDWMKDFLHAHLHPNSPKPKVSRSRPSIPAIKPREPAASPFFKWFASRPPPAKAAPPVAARPTLPLPPAGAWIPPRTRGEPAAPGPASKETLASESGPARTPGSMPDSEN